ncbi:MAG: hypothetical protein EHM45_19960 [Desulfobacteraceae bacterium]|nr:MAG: hypothetical protein EHM45_19960 [Desulfobacteraceae bacterium]
MGRYGRSISPAANLAKMLNCLIAFTIMAGFGFMALPSFVMSNKSILESKGGTNNSRMVARLERQKKMWNQSNNKAFLQPASMNAQEKSNVTIVREIPSRDENKDEEKEIQE